MSPIRSEAEYKAALAHVAVLMDAADGPKAEAELVAWCILIEKYEDEHFAIRLRAKPPAKKRQR